jgi:poly-gamma-glutamate synthesis protein (capsule biosynthesis protein)
MPTIAAVGDVRIYRDKPETSLAHMRDVFKQADICFCQSESSYSDKGSQGSSGPRGASPVDVRMYPAFASAGFDVVSMASNHTMDWGRDAFLDCIERLRGDGIKVIGAGKNIAEARTPAIVECQGTRIAFLGYCSVAPKGYYASAAKVGVAPMRAITHYEQLEDDQPGTPAKIMTWPLQHDLDALLEDVKRVRSQVDIVAVSLHWGVHHIRGLIADYQPVVAHAAIDAGADIIIGHHPHVLKGIEVYRGKVILYSIGDFARDYNQDRAGDVQWAHECEEVYKIYGSAFAGGQGAISNRFSMVAEIQFAAGKIERVAYRPVMIEHEDGGPQPKIVPVGSQRGEEIIQFVKDITRDAGLNAKFRVEGEKVIVET